MASYDPNEFAQELRQLAQQHLKQNGLSGLVIDTILISTIMADDGVQEMHVSSTNPPPWVIRGMMLEAEDIMTYPIYEEYDEESGE